MNLILVSPFEVDDQNRCVLVDERARHIRKVLRAEPGKVLRMGVLNGPLGEGTVERIESGRVELQCVFADEIPALPRVDLLLAMPRPKVLKRMWAQLSALGVGRIVLLRAEKVERYYFDSHVLAPEFYQNLLIEGLQQARCTRLPEVMVRPLFKPFVEDELPALFDGQLKLLADPSGTCRLRDFPPLQDQRRVVLAIGPEGGWTPYELEKLSDCGFELFGMGTRILRTDTATVGLLATLNEWMAPGPAGGR